MDQGIAETDLARWVHDALVRLDDLPYLQTHPLAERLTADRRMPSRGKALRQLLVDAIEELRPGPGSPAGSRARRGYQALALRYVEGLEVAAIQARLAISRSAYYREYQLALAAVVSVLRERGGAPTGADGAPRPAPTGAAPPLPVPLTSFVGRERELARVRHLLGAGRLLTLTGPPGTGKTRLAMEVAAELSAAFADGVCVVPLAQLRHPDLVVPAIARALGAPDGWGPSAVDRLAAAAGTKQVLLLLEPVPNLRRYAMDSLRWGIDTPSVKASRRSFVAGCCEGRRRPFSNCTVHPIVGNRL